MEDIGNDGTGEMKGLKKWRTWENGGNLGKTEDLGKWRNWGNGELGEMEET
jgi:hypothetical protein